MVSAQNVADPLILCFNGKGSCGDVPTIGLPAGVSKGDFLKAIDGHVITQDELVGLYGR